MSLKQLSKEELRQTSFIELAHEILVEKKQAMAFEEIVSEIKGLLEISDKEVKSRLLQFYTDLNIDGRYIAMGDNRWGLREWYPVDQIEEETVPTMKSSKKKKAKKKDEDLDLDDFDDLDDEDLDYDDLDDADDDDDLTDDDDDVDVDDADEDLDLDEDEEELEIDEFDDVDDEDEDEDDELEEEEEK
ncbi:DNA-directed RNA polymerase subunit delta [Bacillus sp. V-88]|uniref:DNA-directed RNA polymerase subunit delta n=1 Tax=Rossellomorea vietnamensis TaxID=218284 RepID=UPI00054D3E55|nr:DNA-directed RNA polymerase subunit delta [Rossellomorea vietnamensis]OXS55784.1 DNA-directed RNA polymerase subunit delta [Bacillus sp. DSM 27956]PRX71494.1 DNA-directed RNA polymerase subunit delta [Bacillus sp. V-88]SLK24479.1 DNA-directed RNA polymerase subunit delta [Bacillus sp. V-88]